MQLEKIRFEVLHAGLIWEVDVYQGSLLGIILAEVELQHEEQHFSEPDWIGFEVLGDARFNFTAMFSLQQKLSRSLTVEDVLAAPL